MEMKTNLTTAHIPFPISSKGATTTLTGASFATFLSERDDLAQTEL